MPLAMFIDASVTMNGGICVLAMMAPLNRPKMTPERMPMRMPAISGRPHQTTAAAPSTPDMAMMEPTDRSMPPRIMTMVMPQASSRFGALWRSTLKMLRWVRKVLCVVGQM